METGVPGVTRVAEGTGDGAELESVGAAEGGGSKRKRSRKSRQLLLWPWQDPTLPVSQV